jgi:hypothetical protein
MLTYKWDPDQTVIHRPPPAQNGSSFNLGAHPADPHSTALPSPTTSGFPGPNIQQQQVPGLEIWVYDGNGVYVGLVSLLQCLISYFRSYTFWRFAIQVPLGLTEMQITYSINQGQELEFYVPGRNQNMRWAAHSVSNY